MRKRGLLWAGAVVRMIDMRIPRRVMLGTLACVIRVLLGRTERSWMMQCLEEDLMAFGMEMEG